MCKPLVKPHEPLIVVKNADALVDVFERCADQFRLIIHQATTLHPFHPNDVGNVGLHDHGLPTSHAVFAHLNPAIPDHADVEHHMFFAVALHTLRHPCLGG